MTNVDVTCRRAVDEEKVIALRFGGHIEVLAHFDVALCAEDKSAAVAPGAQALRV